MSYVVDSAHLESKQVFYLLTSKFDNTYGPTITCQYPNCIPGFDVDKGPQETSNAFQLANLMIPDNIEHQIQVGADCTIFTLFYNKALSGYQLLPPDEQVQEDGQRPSQIYFINVVRAQGDANDSRGAKIRSIALGTALSNVEIMKPILSLALEHMMQNDDIIHGRLVSECFDAVNSLDLSMVREVLERDSLQQMLQVVADKDSLNNALDDSTECGRRVRKMLKLDRKDRYGNRIMLNKGKILIHFDQYVIDEKFKNLTEQPLSVDLVRCLPMRANTCGFYALTLLQRLIPLLDKIPSSEYSFRIIINSQDLTKEQICRFVIGLSSMMGCYRFSDQMKSDGAASTTSLPYVEISMINSLKDHFATHEKSSSFYVIGTANPIFMHHTDLWDFYYNLDDGTMVESQEQSNNKRNSLWDPPLLKKFLHMNINEMTPFQIQDQTRTGLLDKFLSIIKEENPKSSEALSALKKVNVVQLMYLNNLLTPNQPHELNLAHSYSIYYKDFVKFEEFFSAESQKNRSWYTDLDVIISGLFQPYQNVTERQDGLSRLHEALEEILQHISINRSNLELFVVDGINYPFLSSALGDDLLRRDFSNVNIQKDFSDFRKKDKSWLRMADDENAGGVIKCFAKDRSLILLSLPLLFSSAVRRPRKSETQSLDRISGASALTSSAIATSLSPNSASQRPRSMSFKWVLNLANPKSRDSFLDTVSLRPGSDTSVYSLSSAISSLTTAGIGNGSSSSISSESSSLLSSPPKVSYKVLRAQTEKVKALAFEVLFKIEQHPIGELLVKTSLNPFLRLVFEGSKVGFAKDLDNAMLHI